MACQQEVHPSYNDVRAGKSLGACKCRGKRIANKLTMPAEQAVAIMLKWGWEPLNDYPGAGKAWQCTCAECGNLYPKKLAHVQEGRGSCRACSGRDYTDEQARDIMRGAGLIPDKLVVYPGGNLAWPSTCVVCHGDVPAVTLSRVKQRGSYCPTCWERRRGKALMLTNEEAEARMEAALWRPLEEFPGVSKRWHSLCLVCSLEGRPRLHNIRGHRRSCDTCAERGIDMQKPGFLYLVTHQGHGAGKLGIATDRGRIQQHLSKGWLLHREWSVPKTETAWVVEQEVLAWIRRSGRGPVLRDSAMKQGGWTETFALSGSTAVAIDAVARTAGLVFARRRPKALDVVGPPQPLHPKKRRAGR